MSTNFDPWIDMSACYRRIEPKSSYTEKDTRLNIHELDQLSPPGLQEIKTNAMAVACLMDSEMLEPTLRNYKFSSEVKNLTDRTAGNLGAPLANNEKFRLEKAPGFGTGFLVGRRELMTAAHCVFFRDGSLKPLKDKRVVFRFQKGPNSEKTEFGVDDVYNIKKVKRHNYKPNGYGNGYLGDWALIKLDRPVNITPVQMDFSPPKEGDEVYSLGCPTGTCVKFAPGNIKEVDSASDLIRGDVEIFNGNSGGPIINRSSHRVVGITVSGPPDWIVQVGAVQRLVQTVPDYTGYQKIIPSMLEDEHLRIAEQGRQLRILLSDQNSNQFLLDQQWELINVKKECSYKKVMGGVKTVFGALFTPIGIGLPLLADGLGDLREVEFDIDYANSYISKIELTKKRFPYRLNEKEAFLISDYLEPRNYSDVEYCNLTLIVRNMCAYDIPYEYAKRIEEIGEQFHWRFSPDKILDLLINEFKSGISTDNSTFYRKRFLKHLQRCDPANNGFHSHEKEHQEIVDVRIREVLMG